MAMLCVRTSDILEAEVIKNQKTILLQNIVTGSNYTIHGCPTQNRNAKAGGGYEENRSFEPGSQQNPLGSSGAKYRNVDRGQRRSLGNTCTKEPSSFTPGDQFKDVNKLKHGSNKR